jgi:hypothetical protein
MIAKKPIVFIEMRSKPSGFIDDARLLNGF